LKTQDASDVQELFSKASVNFVWQIIAGKRYSYDDQELFTILDLHREANEIGNQLMNGAPGLSPIFE